MLLKTIGLLLFSAGLAHAAVSEPISVEIDIDPDSPKSFINLLDNTVEVAILSSPGFKPLRVKVRTIRFGRTGTEDSRIWCRRFFTRDLNGDRVRDLICKFSIADAGFEPDDEGTATLTGRTLKGTPFVGTASVFLSDGAGLDENDPGIRITSLEVDDICAGPISQIADVDWQVNDAGTRPLITITAIDNDGSTKTRQYNTHRFKTHHFKTHQFKSHHFKTHRFGSTTSGTTRFAFRAQEGGQAIITATVQFDGGTSVDTRSFPLSACVDLPPPPDPGVGYLESPSTPPTPPPLGDRGSDLNEVDLVHIGGSPLGPAATRLVSAVGTGGVVRLSSWTVNPGTQQPELLANAEPNIVGYNAKLHALTPDASPDLSHNPFLSGVIRDEKLWLTSWRLEANGMFKEFDTLGFGDGVPVEEFAIAHRNVEVKSGDATVDIIQVVTPIIDTNNKTRLVTWLVNPTTLNIIGIEDSGPVSGNIPGTNSTISVTAMDDNDKVDYVVTYRDTGGNLNNQFWQIFNPGSAFLRGKGSSGLNIRGSAAVQEPIQQANALPLTPGGYLIAAANGNDTNMSVWDFHLPSQFDVELVPYKITDDSFDQDGGLGVDVGPMPSLSNGTDSRVQGGAVQNVRAILTDSLLEEDGVGQGEIVNVFPAGEFSHVGFASVAKVMVLLLAAEAIADGQVALDDDVVVSAAAANFGGSTMNLVEGEIQSLGNLMYGMMLVSGNDATIAVSEHIAVTEADFLDLMNDRAAGLGLSFPLGPPNAGVDEDIYNRSPAGIYSTPQDQVTLLRFGDNKTEEDVQEIFHEFATEKLHTACGTLNGQQICRDLVKFSDCGYPGLGVWKNGNIGWHNQTLRDLGVPLCTDCLTSEATRAGRSYFVGIQQSDNRWPDTCNLYDYGFRLLLTPDFRGGTQVLSTPIIDLGMDNITDLYAATATIRGTQSVQVCSWSIFVDTGDADRLRCTSVGFNDLPGGSNQATPTQIDSARVSTLLHEGDYLTTQNVSGNLDMKLWRVAPKE